MARLGKNEEAIASHIHKNCLVRLLTRIVLQISLNHRAAMAVYGGIHPFFVHKSAYGFPVVSRGAGAAGAAGVGVAALPGLMIWVRRRICQGVLAEKEP